MLKKICYLLILLMFFCSLAYAQDPTPTIYVSLIDNFGQKGFLKMIDPVTLKEKGQLSDPSDALKTITLRLDQKVAFIANSIQGIQTAGFTQPYNKGIVVVDLVESRVITKILPDSLVFDAEISKDGFLYVTSANSTDLVIIDTNSFQVVGQIPLPVSKGAASIAFSPDGTKAFIADDAGLAAAVIDTKLRQVIGRIDKAMEPHFAYTNEIVVSPDGNTFYITGSKNISIIDANSFTKIGLIPIEGVLNSSLLLEMGKDGKYIYALEGTGQLCIIDRVAQKVIKSIPLPNLGIGRGIKLSDDGRLLYMTGLYKLYVIDTRSNELINTIDVNPDKPTGSQQLFVGLVAVTGDVSTLVGPFVTINSPNPSELVQKGKPFTIKWNTDISPRLVAGVKQVIEFSPDNFNFQAILGVDGRPAANLPGDAQSFVWNVPNMDINKAVIRITAVDEMNRTSTTTINITLGNKPVDPGDTQAPLVQFKNPSGGESFIVGDTINISWNSSDNIGVASQELALSTDGGTSFPFILASGLAGTVQSFSLPTTSMIVTDKARLRLIVKDAAGNTAQTTTAQDFSIKSKPQDNQAPIVTISRPNGDKMGAGQPITVNWQSKDDTAVMSQELLLSLDGGESFHSMASFGATESSFVLKGLPELSQTTAKAVVKITAVDANGNQGEATANFSVAPVITMVNYSKKVLVVNGLGFIANGITSEYQLLINGKQVADFQFNGNNTTFSLTRSKKKLAIVKGSNTLQFMVNGQISNSLNF